MSIKKEIQELVKGRNELLANATELSEEEKQKLVSFNKQITKLESIKVAKSATNKD